MGGTETKGRWLRAQTQIRQLVESGRSGGCDGNFLLWGCSDWPVVSRICRFSTAQPMVCYVVILGDKIIQNDLNIEQSY